MWCDDGPGNTSPEGFSERSARGGRCSLLLPGSGEFGSSFIWKYGGSAGAAELVPRERYSLRRSTVPPASQFPGPRLASRKLPDPGRNKPLVAEARSHLEQQEFYF